MIVAEQLTKRFGSKLAVSDVSFQVPPGKVTGFLGPNGSGKSTTMRMIVGLDIPTSGSVTVNGSQYANLGAPMREVGALLDAKAVHPGRTARNHLRALAATHGIGTARVDELIELTGLTSVATQRVGRFSLGMHQRLGIAVTLLGDPRTIILDEPINGLDADGVSWVRALVRRLAAEGRTVLLSSHLMSEMALTADHVIILGRGRVLADTPVADLVNSLTSATVQVGSPRLSDLVSELTQPDLVVTATGPGRAEISGITAAAIGELAAARGIPLTELTPRTGSLEDAYLALTANSVEYQAVEYQTKAIA